MEWSSSSIYLSIYISIYLSFKSLFAFLFVLIAFLTSYPLNLCALMFACGSRAAGRTFSPLSDVSNLCSRFISVLIFTPRPIALTTLTLVHGEYLESHIEAVNIDFGNLPLRNRHRRHQVHLVRGPALAQRLLHLLELQEQHGRQGLHHGRRGHHLPRVRQEEADGRHRGAVACRHVHDECYSFYSTLLSMIYHLLFSQFIDVKH